MINKFDMQQDIERVLVSEEDIHARIREVGAQISEDYRGKCPILVGVLKGVVPFFGEMSQAITVPVQEDFMCVTSFEGGTESTWTGISMAAAISAKNGTTPFKTPTRIGHLPR